MIIGLLIVQLDISIAFNMASKDIFKRIIAHHYHDFRILFTNGLFEVEGKRGWAGSRLYVWISKYYSEENTVRTEWWKDSLLTGQNTIQNRILSGQSGVRTQC